MTCSLSVSFTGVWYVLFCKDSALLLSGSVVIFISFRLTDFLSLTGDCALSELLIRSCWANAGAFCPMCEAFDVLPLPTEWKCSLQRQVTMRITMQSVGNTWNFNKTMVDIKSTSVLNKVNALRGYFQGCSKHLLGSHTFAKCTEC